MDDTFFNAMSYHNATPDLSNPGYLLKDRLEDRRTEMQLDVATDAANRPGDDNDGRAKFVSGKTYFVSTTGSNDSGEGLKSASPYRTVWKAVTKTNPAGGDILLIRVGSYDERLTISKPVTLRAGRGSVVNIGRKN